MKARIENIEVLAEKIKLLRLAPVASARFPASSAGGYILLEIPGPDRVWKNAYSLTNPPGAQTRYEIIVRRVAHSRGGSAWLHDHAEPGQQLEITAPANLFPIDRIAKNHLLLSAGIGITPFLSYVPALRTLAAEFEMHHCCRQEEAGAFRALLPQAEHITLHTSRNSLDLAGVLSRQHLHTQLYICGPEPFMDFVVAAARALGWPRGKIHQERFGGATGGAPFSVRLAKSGLELHVAEDQTLLEALEAAGLDPPRLCRGGACGACELPLLAGVPEHHDHFLGGSAHAAGRSIMTCVSRAKTPELVLDF